MPFSGFPAQNTAIPLSLTNLLSAPPQSQISSPPQPLPLRTSAIMTPKNASFALLLLAATHLGGTSAQNLRAPPRIGDPGKIIEKVNPDIGGLKIVEEAPLKSTRNIRDKSATSGLPSAEIELGRFYNKDVRIERDKRTGAYVVKGRFDLKRYEAAQDPAPARSIARASGDFDDDCGADGEGSRPPRLHRQAPS